MTASATAKPQNPIARQHYLDLPESLYSPANPEPSEAPSLIELNLPLLNQWGVDAAWFQSDQGLAVLTGNAVEKDNPPIAMAYSGHQFGHWSPVLGDGRAHMLGQLAASDGALFDVQLKGSGRTPYSRGGDGRATLGSVLREYIISEAMAGLGIATTRSLAVLGTGNKVYREQPLPGAILVRSASSHIRVGSFQYAASQDAGTPADDGAVKALADFVIAKHFPDLAAKPEPYLELLDAVTARQASLIAQWMLVGFIHGVMNTDNMSIVGETIDYGPCAFMDTFDPNKVFSSIDRGGRYAWDQQASIAVWNLTRFAETLLPLLHETEEKAVELATESLNKFSPLFRDKYQSGLRQKLGLSENTEEVTMFTDTTLATLAENQLDFTVFFDRLTHVADGEAESLVIELFSDTDSAAAWLKDWQALRAKGAESAATMRQANPTVIARNHRVEEAIQAAVENDNFEPFRRLCRVLANPYELAQEGQELQTPPLPAECVTQTFCGT